jgi:predicted SprT family Zn-dependent metalloprotease
MRRKDRKGCLDRDLGGRCNLDLNEIKQKDDWMKTENLRCLSCGEKLVLQKT